MNAKRMLRRAVRQVHRPLVLALAAAWPLAMSAAAREAPVADLRARAERPIAHLPVRPPEPAVATLAVENCDDDGPGSLRALIASAISGDTIDLTQLPCNAIALGSEILIEQPDLTLQGPGADALSISASESRVFHHLDPAAEPGTLTINDLGVSGGQLSGAVVDQPLLGGCIVAYSSVALNRVVVSGCSVRNLSTAGSANARGGGVAARALTMTDSIVRDCMAATLGEADVATAMGGGILSGELTLTRSAIIGNGVSMAPVAGGGAALGGGAFVYYELLVTDSTIAGNHAQGDPARAGGLAFGELVPDVARTATIVRSTIAGNHAQEIGGLDFASGDAAVTILDSTISGNSDEMGVGGGAFIRGVAILIRNTTIAHNSSGLRIENDATMTSTIAANNIDGDLFGAGSPGVLGSGNLIGSSNLSLPADTITADPQLGPLAYNGGPTKTHALAATSPAIDAGNNAAALATDQRGEGHPRVVGARADIGAFERNAEDDDTVFADGFD